MLASCESRRRESFSDRTLKKKRRVEEEDVDNSEGKLESRKNQEKLRYLRL